MITEIWVDGKKLDMYSETNIRHTLQVNDIAEVKDRQASYTNSFAVPKTPNNVQIFGGLGIPSDTSRIPYLKPDCRMKIEGFDFIVKGWINVTDTNDDYKIYIYSGIINFFKEIGNKTLGDPELDLTEIDHKKDLNSVIQSFSNPNYKYLITDYNGLTHFGDNDSKINIDHLVPSVRVKYLWDKIHEKAGFKYKGKIFETEDFINLFLTYPKFIAIDILTLIKENSGSKSLGTTNIPTNDPNLHYIPLQVNGYVNNQYFLTPETGLYKLTFQVNSNRDFYIDYLLCINQEGIPYASKNYTLLTYTDENNYSQTIYLNVQLNAGDRIYFFAWWRQVPNGALNWTANYNIKWELFKNGEVAFSNELKDFPRTDFVKEILNRFGLTPFFNEFSNTIDYLTITERINDAEVIDWSEKFIERTSESYVYESYAQQNIFSCQYNDKEGVYSDGIIKISNLNIQEKKEVFKSKIYSPERDFIKFKINNNTEETLRVFKFYDKQVKEKNGQTEVEYKGLEKRYHFIKERSIVANAVIGSKALSQSQAVSSLPLAEFKGLDWPSLLQKNYSVFGLILNDSRLHDINLNLDFVDYLTVDLRKLYFFEQEQQYYILNKLQFDNNKSKGEFVRVKRYYDLSEIIDPIDPVKPFINIVWEDNTNTPKAGTSQQIQGKINSSYAQNNDPFVTFEWEKHNGTSWVGLGTGTSPYNLPLTNGTQKFRMKVITQLNNTIYSNELQYEKFVIVCRRYRVRGQVRKDLIIEFINCNGEPSRVVLNNNTWTPEYIFCASEGSVNTNGTIEDQGFC